jgi:prophage regulatory protein
MFNNTPSGANMRHTIDRMPTTVSKSGNSRSTIYLRITQGLWTKPVKLGPRMVGWPSSENDALIEARIAGRSDDEIRALVITLEATRGADVNATNMSAKKIFSLASAEGADLNDET